MYAIVEINGKQYKVEKDATVNVDKFAEETTEVTLDKVLLYSDGKTVTVGTPYVTNVKVKATVLQNIKGDKVRGIKFKKRKRYTRTIGHRQSYAQLKIGEFIVAG